MTIEHLEKEDKNYTPFENKTLKLRILTKKTTIFFKNILSFI